MKREMNSGNGKNTTAVHVSSVQMSTTNSSKILEETRTCQETEDEFEKEKNKLGCCLSHTRTVYNKHAKDENETTKGVVEWKTCESKQTSFFSFFLKLVLVCTKYRPVLLEVLRSMSSSKCGGPYIPAPPGCLSGFSQSLRICLYVCVTIHAHVRSRLATMGKDKTPAWVSLTHRQ